jgi:hypothetical protein
VTAFEVGADAVADEPLKVPPAATRLDGGTGTGVVADIKQNVEKSCVRMMLRPFGSKFWDRSGQAETMSI